MHMQNISIHTVTLYFTSSFNDSFIQDNVETHVQEIINEGTTRMILIIPLNACRGGRFLVICLLGLSIYHFFINQLDKSKNH